MLPAKHRFGKKKEVEAVFRKGKFYRSQHFSARFLPNNLPRSRFTVIIGKKNAKKAVVRNKVKRLVRESLRARIPEIKKGFDVVIQIRGEIQKPDPKKISEGIETLLQSIHLLPK